MTQYNSMENNGSQARSDGPAGAGYNAESRYSHPGNISMVISSGNYTKKYGKSYFCVQYHLLNPLFRAGRLAKPMVQEIFDDLLGEVTLTILYFSR